MGSYFFAVKRDIQFSDTIYYLFSSSTCSLEIAIIKLCLDGLIVFREEVSVMIFLLVDLKKVIVNIKITIKDRKYIDTPSKYYF